MMVIKFRADSDAPPIWDLFVKCIAIDGDLNPHLSRAEDIRWIVEDNVLSPANFRLSRDEPSKGSAWPRKDDYVS